MIAVEVDLVMNAARARRAQGTDSRTAVSKDHTNGMIFTYGQTEGALAAVLVQDFCADRAP